MIRSRSSFLFTARKEILHATRMRSNDSYQLRMLARSCTTNAERAVRKANTRKISIHSPMTRWPLCGKRSELLAGAVPGLDTRAVDREAGSRRSLRHAHQSIL